MEEKNKENCGLVYALTNPAMPGLVKIGMTSRKDISQRIKELSSSTGVPVPFECQYACIVEDFERVEKALHKAFFPNRINLNREFFQIEVEQAIAILELLGPNNAIKEVNEDIEASITPTEKSARERMKKRPAFNLDKMDIPAGAKLIFTRDSSVEVEVVPDNKVIYNGDIMSLTAVTQQLLPYKATRPTFYWTYEGEKLSDIWERSLHE